ncbi:MAG: DUF2059 domain-containing protein [Hyphomicrobiaceae bacterium]|nr:DUF2059 domain-containing protein [Hyphomicrobiaceae bacterium]
MKRTLVCLSQLVLVAGVLALAAPAFSQEATPPPDPANVAAAQDMVKAMDARGQALASIAQLRQALVMHVQANEPNKVVGFTAYTDKELDPQGPRVAGFLSDLENIAVQFYARNFSIEEMKSIAAFQASEAGRKFNKLTPELGGLVATRMGQFQTDLIKAVEKGAAAQPDGK